MCGIAGRFSTTETPNPNADREAVAAMLRALIHRGPDTDGLETFGSPGFGTATFGFRRLSILDLTEFGNQPQFTADRRIATVFNGEIYNFPALRQQLIARGIELRSTGDAEILKHLYRIDGDAFLDKLEGMFAIAVVDLDRSRFLLARDRYGKKPLYYRHDGPHIDFASEPAALIAGGARAECDPVALLDFLTFGYVCGERSAFVGIERVAPGTKVVFENGRLTTETWYRMPEALPRAITLDAAADEAWKHIVPAVEERFWSDVPLGLFLSGGIDSGLIAAAAQELGRAPRCFTIGFDDPRYDERELARATAKHLGLELVEQVVTPDPLRAIDDVAAAFDEPFADASAIPTLALSKLARQHVTVALSGDGGDESFAGYRRHRLIGGGSALDRVLPRVVRRVAAGCFRESGNGTAGRSFLGQVRRFASALPLDVAERNAYWATLFSSELRQRFLAPELLERARGHAPDALAVEAFRARPGTALRRCLDGDFERYLPDDLLVKTDRASMAHSLEVRCPLLARGVVEFARGLPDQVLLAGNRTKAVLRELARRKLPATVATATKRGFGVPLVDWLRGPLAKTARDRLTDPSFESRRIVRAEAVDDMLARHASAREDWSSQIYALLVFDAWSRRFGQ